MDGAPRSDDSALGPRRLAVAVLRCVRFYSRLPTPKLSFEADKHAAPDFRVEPIGLPVAALLIALPAMLVMARRLAEARPLPGRQPGGRRRRDRHRRLP